MSAASGDSVREDVKVPDLVVRLLGSFTVDPLLKGFDFWFGVLGLAGRVDVAPYGQIVQTLLTPAPRLPASARRATIVMLRVRDWLRELPADRLSTPGLVGGHLSASVQDVVRAAQAHAAQGAGDTLFGTVSVGDRRARPVRRGAGGSRSRAAGVARGDSRLPDRPGTRLSRVVSGPAWRCRGRPARAHSARPLQGRLLPHARDDRRPADPPAARRAAQGHRHRLRQHPLARRGWRSGCRRRGVRRGTSRAARDAGRAGGARRAHRPLQQERGTGRLARLRNAAGLAHCGASTSSPRRSTGCPSRRT